MRQLCIVVMLFATSFTGQTQSSSLNLPDSLSLLLQQNKQEDMARIETLSKVVEYFFKENQMGYNENSYNSILHYINEISELSEKLDYLYGKAFGNYYRGIYYYDCSDFVKAQQYMVVAQNILLSMPDTQKRQELLLHYYTSISACYLDCSMLSEAYEAIQKGLKIAKETKNIFSERLIKNNLAVFYYKMNHLEEALSIHKEILEDPILPGFNKYISYLNIHLIYSGLLKSDSALIYLDSASYYISPPISPVFVLYSKGIIYSQKSDFKTAEQYYKEAFDISGNTPKIQVNILTYWAVAEYHLKKYSKALSLVRSGLQIAETYQYYEEQKQGLDIIIKILEALGRHKEALQYVTQCYSVTDSLDKIQKKDYSNQLLLQKEIKNMEEQTKINLLQQEYKHKKRQTILYIILLLLVLAAIFIFLLFKWKSASLKNKKIELKNREVELDLRNRELTSNILSQMQKNELLNEVINHLNRLKNDSKKPEENIHLIINELNQMMNNNLRKDFDYYFVRTHPDFYDRLLVDFPHLTQYELRLCAFLKLNLSTKDIAAINNITMDSVKTARKRLRKTLNIINPNDSFTGFFTKY